MAVQPSSWRTFFEETMNDYPHSPTRLLSSAVVQDRTSLSRATIWRRVRSGEFPAPLKLGPNRIAWRESDVDNWIAGLGA